MNGSSVLRSKRAIGVQPGPAARLGTAPRAEHRERRPAARARTTDGCRAALESERRRLMLALESAELLEVPMVGDSMDSSSLEHERHVALDARSRKAVLLAEVNAALERIRRGAYGLCMECEEPISAGRLNALPWARLCLRCQKEEEIGDRFATGESGLSGEPVEAV